MRVRVWGRAVWLTVLPLAFVLGLGPLAHASGTGNTATPPPPDTLTQYPVTLLTVGQCSGSTSVFDQTTQQCIAPPTMSAACPSGWITASDGGCTNPAACPSGELLASWSGGSEAGCIPSSDGCPYHETLVGDICQGVPSPTYGTGGTGPDPETTYTCTGNGVATAYTHNTDTGALLAVEEDVPLAACAGYVASTSGGTCVAPAPGPVVTTGPFVAGCASSGTYLLETTTTQVTWTCPGPTASASFTTRYSQESTSDCQPTTLIDSLQGLACISGQPGFAWVAYTYQHCLSFEGGTTACSGTATYTPPSPYTASSQAPFVEPAYDPVACPVPTAVGP